MHFAIDAGHNSRPGDTGAIGLESEDKLTAQLASSVINKLENTGHKVTLCGCPYSKNLGESLKTRVATANFCKADYYISLHFNKFLEGDEVTTKPMGAEIFVASAKGKELADKVLPKITALGWKNRGVKNSGLYVLVHTKMPAILIESFFLDSVADIELFHQVGIDKLATAIVEGLLG
jgi:N-acetylmuramoyl-L-alanine amidase